MNFVKIYRLNLLGNQKCPKSAICVEYFQIYTVTPCVLAISFHVAQSAQPCSATPRNASVTRVHHEAFFSANVLSPCFIVACTTCNISCATPLLSKRESSVMVRINTCVIVSCRTSVMVRDTSKWLETQLSPVCTKKQLYSECAKSVLNSRMHNL